MLQPLSGVALPRAVPRGVREIGKDVKLLTLSVALGQDTQGFFDESAERLRQIRDCQGVHASPRLRRRPSTRRRSSRSRQWPRASRRGTVATANALRPELAPTDFDCCTGRSSAATYRRPTRPPRPPCGHPAIGVVCHALTPARMTKPATNPRATSPRNAINGQPRRCTAATAVSQPTMNSNTPNRPVTNQLPSWAESTLGRANASARITTIRQRSNNSSA